MRSFFSGTLARFTIKPLSVLLFLGLALAPFAAPGADAGFTNNGAISGTSPPNIDATNFLNKGTWNITSFTTPYKTRHTYNYTNENSMLCQIGWQFDFGTGSGGRSWSANFFNDNSGTILAIDNDFLGNFLGIATPQSFLLVSATNIVNQGLLEAGAGGEIILTGSKVVLSRSTVGITNIVGTGGLVTQTNFTPDTAIYDLFWGQTTNQSLPGPAVWDGTIANSQEFGVPTGVTDPCGAIVRSSIVIIPTLAASITNWGNLVILTITNGVNVLSGAPITTSVLFPSNIVHQAVFVAGNTNTISEEIRFAPSSSPTNFFKTVTVRLATTSTNLFTRVVQNNTLFLVDTLASETNRSVLPNNTLNPSVGITGCSADTFRPANFTVSRLAPSAYFNGTSNNLVPPPDFLSNPDYVNPKIQSLTVSNLFSSIATYSAYSLFMDNLASEPPVGFAISNAVGRIRIYANDLDLTRVRMTAPAQIIIQASNLISSAGALMDCPNLSYTLGSTNGLLNITNLAASSVSRFQGNLTAWSGNWSNGVAVIFNNIGISNSVTTNGAGASITNYFTFPSPLTNMIQFGLAVLIVDARGVASAVPVTVQDLVLHSTNIVVSDFMNVSSSLLLDGTSATIVGGVNLFGSIQNWTFLQAPKLRYLTNNGVISVFNNAHFGDDGPTNYAAFVNRGFIFAGGQIINSDYLEINGESSLGENDSSSGDFLATCLNGLVESATIGAGGSIQFNANSLLIQNSKFFADNALVFNVTGSLSDGGVGTGNSFTCLNGFNLLVKPTTGDLLGTTISDVALNEGEVDHFWAGAKGDGTASSFTNNAAIGTLALAPSTNLFEPFFYFSGTTGSNGMYVGTLDLSQLGADYANEMDIDPTLNIYYAHAILANGLTNSVSPGVPGSAEQILDGQFLGHLHYVSGITSFVHLGSSARNGLTGKAVPAGGYKLSVSGQPGTFYALQASTNLVNWVSIYTNNSPPVTNGLFQFVDPDAAHYPTRFYRAVPVPVP